MATTDVMPGASASSGGHDLDFELDISIVESGPVIPVSAGHGPDRARNTKFPAEGMAMSQR